MNKILFITVVILFIKPAIGQNPCFWAHNFGSGFNWDEGKGVAIDDSGNVYVTGYFYGTTDFDPGPDTINLTPAGSDDIFVAKYSSTGAYRWAFNIGGTNTDRGYGIATDDSGNVYITSYFKSTADFDPGPGIANLTSVGDEDIYVAKYSTNGQYIWAFNVGSTSWDHGNDITVDDSGNVYVTGYFNNTADFDPGAGTAILTSSGAPGYYDVFIARYNSTGAYQWAFKIGSADYESGYGIATDNNGNVFVTGSFNTTADFDPGAGTANITSNGGSDIFVARYSSTGVYSWAFNIGGNGGNDIGYDIALDSSGNVYVTGNFYGTADFNPGAGTANLTTVGSGDAFFAKYDITGNYLWAKNIGSTNFDESYSIASDSDGNIYITGYFYSTVDFNPGPGIVNLTSNGSNDIFVAKYSAAGEYQWAYNFGSADSDFGNGIAVDKTGNVCVTGYFRGAIDFDPGGGTANLTSLGFADIFVVKFPQLFIDAGLVSPVSCYNGNDGATTVAITYGINSPYSYYWSNGETTDTSISLTTGTQSITVTDSKGCLQSDTVNVTQPSQVMTSTGYTPVLCYGDSTGTAEIHVTGGTLPYFSYLWSNGVTGPDDTLLTGIPAGTYYVTVNDANGCSKTDSVAVTEPTTLSVILSKTDISCYGDNNGSATATPSGGTGSYTYQWSSLPQQTTQTAINLQASTYSVTVTDGNGCAFANAITVSQPLPLTLTSSQTNISCYNGSDGTVAITAGGGIIPYQYSKDGGFSYQISDTFYNIAAGSYALVVKDSNNCTFATGVTLTEPTQLTFTTTSNNAICNGGNDGAITINATGGVTNYQYSADGGNNYQPSNVFNNLPADTYLVVVLDANNCDTIATVIITEPGNISATTIQSDISCNGGNDGNITVIASGGTGTLQYSNNNGNTYQFSNAFLNLAADTYMVVVKDAGNCTSNGLAVILTEPVQLSVVITPSDVNCNSGNDGSAIAMPLGGAGNYSYSWSNSQTDSTATGLIAAVYTVTVSDANNCKATLSVTITEPGPLSFAVSSTGSICNHFDGTATATAGGGVIPYSYIWSQGGSNSTATGLSSGNYGITITDTNGCDTTGSITVNVSVVPQDVCIVTIDSLTQKNLVAWQKTPGLGTLGFIIYKEIFTNIYDSIGYVLYDSLSDYIDFASDPKTKAERYKIATMDSCGNISLLSDSHRTILLTASVGVNNERNLAWNDYEGISFISQYRIWRGTALNNITLIDSVVYGTNLYADWDTLTGVDSLYYFIELVHPTGCNSTLKIKKYNASKSNTANMEAPSLPMNISVLVSNVSCNGGNDGTATATITGGEAPFTYLWDDSQSQSGSTATGLTAGTYNVTVTDNNNTTTTGSAVITEPAAINVSASVTDATSPGNDDGAIDLNVSGGTPPYQFTWSNGAATEDIDSLAADTYTVVVTDANNCQAVYTDTVKLIVNSNYIILNTDFRLLVYPNPNNGKFIVFTNYGIPIAIGTNITNRANYQIRITNIFGQEVFQSQIRSPKTEISLDLPGGVYAVKITADGKLVDVARVVIGR